MWDRDLGIGDWDVGHGTRGRGNVGIRGSGDSRTWDVNMCGRREHVWGSRTWDVGTGGRNKQNITLFLRWICKLQFSAVKWKVIYAAEFISRLVADDSQPRSQGPLSFFLEKVPWLRLVTCLCVRVKSAPRVGLWLNCVNTVYGGESCFALQTLFWKLNKVFVRDPAWPVLRFYPNYYFYEYEMLIEREVCLFSLLF